MDILVHKPNDIKSFAYMWLESFSIFFLDYQKL
jgi:hypothetical protein